ncbi:MAG: DUF2157 domain-containing protein [Rhizobacter sp.]
MNLRLVLFEWAAGRGLDAAASRRLQRLAGFGEEPAGLRTGLVRGFAVLAAALAGFALVMWVAANWATFGRVGRFALVQGALAVLGLGAWAWPAARAPLGLAALFGIGALFALFGQTYQTGADPWQLFALWALLALPLCLGVRSDIVWTPWVVVAMAAISLWASAHTGQRLWRGLDGNGTTVHLAAWAMSLLLVLLIGPPWRGRTGAGAWALRMAITLAAFGISLSALIGLFGDGIDPLYPLGLLLAGAAAWGLSRPAAFDIYGLSAVVLAFDTLLVCGLGRLLFDDGDTEPLGASLLVSVVAAGLLAVSVRWVMRVFHRVGAAP